MSLQKIQTLDSGVEINYHKITSLQFFETRPALVIVSTYLSKDAKDSGKASIDTKSFDMEGLDKSNLISSAYTKLKESKIVNGNLISEQVIEIVPEVLNEDGSVKTPSIINVITPAVYEQVETNFFADALDV